MKRILNVLVIMLLVTVVGFSQTVIKKPNQFVTKDGMQYWPLLPTQQDSLKRLISDFDTAFKALVARYLKEIQDYAIYGKDLPADAVLDSQRMVFITRADAERLAAQSKVILPPEAETKKQDDKKGTDTKKKR